MFWSSAAGMPYSIPRSAMWAKRLNGNTMPRQTRLYFPKYTLRLTVNVCFIMAGVQMRTGADHVPFCKIAHSTMLC